ncbi:trigger factor [candidate division KSB1 bacterium]|nr:trigger factor [candidate division KSB1 bacterium]
MVLQYETVEQSNWQKKIRVQISADRVEPKLEESIRDFQKRAKIEGFRKGKIPRQLVMKMFGPQIESQVYQPFIADAYDKIFKDEKFDVISSPEIENITFDKTQGLAFEIVFDVRPQFKIEDFELTVEKVRFKVEKEDIEALLKELQEKNAMIYSADEAKEGHFVIADLQEVDSSGVPILGQKFEKQTIWLEEGNEEITPQLLGIKPGDERTIRITIPEGAESGPESEIITPSGEKASGPAEKLFRVDVKEIKERKLPELDDEFARDLGDYENIKTLKKELTKNLKERAQYESEGLFHQALVDELIKRNNIDVPQSMLQKYLDAVVDDMKKRSKEKIDEKLVREQYKSLAIRNIKWILLRNQLIEQEALNVTDDEIETHLQARIEEKQIGEEEGKEIRNDKQRFEDYREQLLNEKVYTVLAERATIEETEKPWRQEQTDSETTGQPQKQS